MSIKRMSIIAGASIILFTSCKNTIDKTSTTHKFSFDVQNVTNRQNTFEVENFYDPSTNSIFQENSTQAGIIPVFRYTVNF